MMDSKKYWGVHPFRNNNILDDILVKPIEEILEEEERYIGWYEVASLVIDSIIEPRWVMSEDSIRDMLLAINSLYLKEKDTDSKDEAWKELVNLPVSSEAWLRIKPLPLPLRKRLLSSCKERLLEEQEAHKSELYYNEEDREEFREKIEDMIKDMEEIERVGREKDRIEINVVRVRDRATIQLIKETWHQPAKLLKFNPSTRTYIVLTPDNQYKKINEEVYKEIEYLVEGGASKKEEAPLQEPLQEKEETPLQEPSQEKEIVEPLRIYCRGSIVKRGRDRKTIRYYIIEDRNGNKRTVKHASLKEAIEAKRVIGINIVLTKNGKLMVRQ